MFVPCFDKEFTEAIDCSIGELLNGWLALPKFVSDLADGPFAPVAQDDDPALEDGETAHRNLDGGPALGTDEVEAGPVITGFVMVHEGGLAAGLARSVTDEVADNGEEPCLEGASAVFIGMEVREGAAVGFGGEVFGGRVITSERVREAVDRGLGTVVERGERIGRRAGRVMSARSFIHRKPNAPGRRW